MINKEIKSKATAAKVAKELVNDLTQELDCFGSYWVKLENVGMYYDVVEEEETHFPAFIIQVTYSK